jgi:LytS/YehU family sensor histidine kinase
MLATKNQSDKKKWYEYRIVQHTLFWITLLAFFTITPTLLSGLPFKVILLNNLIFLPGDIIMAYFLIYRGIEPYLLKGKILPFIIIFIITILTLMGISYLLNLYVIPETMLNQLGNKDYQWFESLLSTINVIAAPALVKIIKEYFSTRTKQIELELNSTSQELKMLKTQVNPHFLFNTLNNIDQLTHIDPPKASEAIIKLSSIMRFMLSTSNKEQISIQEEIEYLSSYIDLIKLRLPSDNSLDFNVKCKDYTIKIAPLLFIPFIENAYKHGEKNNCSPCIKIDLLVDGNKLQFSVANLINKNKNVDSTGIGLKNISRRLNLLYPENHTMEVQKTEKTYTVTIIIQVHENKIDHH